MMKEKILFKTAFGSQVWKMDTVESDIDVWMTYQMPSKDILIGRTGPYRLYMLEKYPGIEWHEIGTTCEELLQCNLNYMIAINSPVVLQDWEHLPKLRELSIMNLNKHLYYSVRGMAIRNYKKYIVTGDDNTEKRRGIISRVLSWGTNTLNGDGELAPFMPALPTDENMILKMMKVLDHAYEISKLPEKPQYEDKMFEWLYQRRLEYMA